MMRGTGRSACDRAPLLMVAAVALAWAALVGVFFVVAALRELGR